MIDFGQGLGLDVEFMGHTCHADAIAGVELIELGNCGNRNHGHVCFPSGGTARAGELLSALIHKVIDEKGLRPK